MRLLEAHSPRSWLFVILIISFFAMLGIWFQFLPLERMMMQQGGYGIVDYELAFTSDKTSEILSTWDSNAKSAAYNSLLIDYAFMPAYGLFFASATHY